MISGRNTGSRRAPERSGDSPAITSLKRCYRFGRERLAANGQPDVKDEEGRSTDSVFGPRPPFV